MAHTPPLADLDRVLDLLEAHTGFRPARATIRSYHARGQMPEQTATGQWIEAEIHAWIANRRSRRAPDRSASICRRLASANQHPASNGRDKRLIDLVRQARAIGTPWSAVGAALGMSRQAAWLRYRNIDQ